MIERYLLRYFLSLVEHGTFTRAAEACAVTQPTLSLGIARLEASVGQPLFKRNNRRVELTPAGARLVRHARQIESQFHRAELDMGSAQPKRTLRIGLLASLPSERIARFAARVAQDNGLNVEVIEGRPRELAEALRGSRVDVALTTGREGEEGFRALYTEGYALALPVTHPLAHQPIIAPEDLGDSVMIVRRHCEVLAETSRHFTRAGVRPFFTARTSSDDRALSFVAAGMGLTVMPECFAAPGVARVPLGGFDLLRTIGLAFPSDSPFVDAVTLAAVAAFHLAGLDD